MTGHDDPYLAAAEAYADSAISQLGHAVPERGFLVERAYTRPQLRAAVDAVRQPLLDANQQLTDRIAQLEAERDRRLHVRANPSGDTHASGVPVTGVNVDHVDPDWHGSTHASGHP